MSQKLLVNDFKWVEEISQSSENFKTIYKEGTDIGYFTKAYVQYPKKIQKPYNDLSFLPERIKIEKNKNFQPSCMIKLNMLFT